MKMDLYLSIRGAAALYIRDGLNLWDLRTGKEKKGIVG